MRTTTGTHARRRRATGPVLATALAVALAAWGPAAAADEPAVPDDLEDEPVTEPIVLAKDIDLGTSGPLGPVTVIGDSVLLGSGLWSPTLPDQLVAHGWGPVRYRSSVGMKAGEPSTTNHAAWWVNTWRGGGWDPQDLFVNLGANDSGICTTDVICARTRILDFVASVGPGHRFWWPQVTRNPGAGAEAAAWNTALAQIALERDDFFTWDWPTVMATGGFPSPDNTHLDANGYRERSLLMARQFTADLARAERVGGDANLPTPTGAPGTYVPFDPPVRVVDTRGEAPGRRPDGSELAVDFGGLLPAGASAVAINVTAAGPGDAGYLAAGPCGAEITGSTLNFPNRTERGAMAVTPLGTGDDVCVFNRGETDVIVDLQGVFVEGSSAAGFVPLAAGERLHDSRSDGRADVVVVDTPPSASAVAVNLTVVNAEGFGWLRAAPCGSETGVSNVNFQPFEAVAGSAFVSTSEDDTICVETSVPADVIVDLTGTFGDGGLSYVPVPPSRMLDTRSAIGGWSPVHGSGQTLDIRVTPPDAQAVTGTVTIVGPLTAGFLVGHGCGGPTPPTSSVNAGRQQVLANSLTTGVSGDGRLCVYSQPTTHSLFDVTGWWVS